MPAARWAPASACDRRPLALERGVTVDALGGLLSGFLCHGNLFTFGVAAEMVDSVLQQAAVQLLLIRHMLCRAH